MTWERVLTPVTNPVLHPCWPSLWLQVVIDNMMNLELLLSASKMTGGKAEW